MPDLQIDYKIDYGKLLKVNGLQKCLQVVPGMRNWLTHIRRYSRIERVISEQENTLRLNRCPLSELRRERLGA